MEIFNDPFGVIGDGAWGGAPDPEDQPLKFAQGKVIAWQFLDGTNTVRIQGVDFPNLPTLSGPEAALIRVGDVVGCLKYLNTYMVLGRVNPSGDIRTNTVSAQPTASAIVQLPQVTLASQFVPIEDTAVRVWVPSSRRVKISYSALVYCNGARAALNVRLRGATENVGTRTMNVGALSVAGWWTMTRVATITAEDGLNEGLNEFVLNGGYYLIPGSVPPDGGAIGANVQNRQLIVEVY